jgi:hypothetical protein
MVDYGHGMVGYVLNLISLISGLVVFVISLMVVAIIIYYQYNNRLKREEKITLILSANIYLIILIQIISIISLNIQTLIGDVYGNNFDSSWCILRGYFTCMTCFTLYHTFVVQVNNEKEYIVMSSREASPKSVPRYRLEYRELKIFLFHLLALIQLQ